MLIILLVHEGRRVPGVGEGSRVPPLLLREDAHLREELLVLGGRELPDGERGGVEVRQAALLRLGQRFGLIFNIIYNPLLWREAAAEVEQGSALSLSVTYSKLSKAGSLRLDGPLRRVAVAGEDDAAVVLVERSDGITVAHAALDLGRKLRHAGRHDRVADLRGRR